MAVANRDEISGRKINAALPGEAQKLGLPLCRNLARFGPVLDGALPFAQKTGKSGLAAEFSNHNFRRLHTQLLPRSSSTGLESTPIKLVACTRFVVNQDGLAGTALGSS
jgi:hypothetical protein